MKLSKNDWLGRAVKSSAAAVITLGVLFPSFQIGSVAATAATSVKSEQILASLTEEQQDALRKIQSTESYGLHGFDEKDLKSDKELTVIVEFKSKPEEVAMLEAAVKGKKLTSAEAKNKVDREHSAFKEDVKRILPSAKGKRGNASYKISRSFKTVYNGVSMKLPANEVESLLQSDAVKAVHKSVEFTIEPPAKTDSTEESTKRIESIPFLGVDKLHKEGITGKGVKVGVIDTGIDYNHPDLKDAFKGGYDLVDNDADPMETTYDDWKKSGRPEVDQNLSPYYTSHGTHVSGTIAGRAKNTSGVAVKGIAPDAELYGYRVLGPYGTGELEDILAGIERAVTDEMDVINLSLGININDPLYPTSTAVNYAVLSGVTAVVSAGNNGSNSYTLGSPGAAALALTVGASSAPIPVTKYTGELSGIDTDYELSNLYTDFVTDLKVFDNQTFEVVDLGAGNDSDYLNKDVTGKIVFVDPGYWQPLTINAKKHGARAIIAYNNRPNEGPTPFVKEDQNFIPAFSMSYEQGLDFKAKLAAGQNKMMFNNFKEVYTEGDKLASFSSRGPSRSNYDIKPEFTAPGVSVLSSVPAYAIYKNDPSNYQFAYTRMSGTSMAAPHVAGISALLLQANSDLQPSDIKTILMNTAKPLAEDYSVFEVGAGRVDPYRAVHAGMKLQVQDETPISDNEDDVAMKEETGGLSFGNHYAGEEVFIEKAVNIVNLEDKKKKFNVAVQFQTNLKGSIDAKVNGVKVDVSPVMPVQSLTTKKVLVSITVPKTAKAGIYEGYLIMTNQDDKNEQYRIPFSVRTTEEGFNLTSLSSLAISPPHLHVKRSFSVTPSTELIANFKAPMKRLDLVLVDGKTGADIGYLGRIFTENAYDGMTYNFGTAFDGTYYPYTGNEEEPISFKKSYAKPGHYKIKIIGTSERDRMFTNENDLFIDHNSPTMTTSLDVNESPVIEYQPGQTTVPLQVKLTDEELEQMKVAGMNVAQAMKLNYSVNGNFNPVIPLREDGTVDLNVPMNESSPFLRYTINGLDAAKNTTDKRNYYFVKAGTPYGYMKTDNKNVKMGDTVSTTLVLNNVDKLKSAEWTLSNIGQSFEIVEVKPNDALADYGTAQVNVETTGNTSKVKLTLDGTKPVNGNIPAINLTLKVKDTAFTVSAAVNPTVAYTNELGNRISLSSAGMEWMIQPTFSEVYGSGVTSLKAEAIAYNADWRKLGASIKLIDTNGTKYDGSSTIAIFGAYIISKLPITDKTFDWELTVPGHFTMKREITVGVEKKGIVWGQSLQYFNEGPVAGDVNQDDVIDIRDALAIQQAWNTNDRAADINFDGVVDAKDIQFVINHYLKQNPDADNPPAPIEQADGKTLQDILTALQIY